MAMQNQNKKHYRTPTVITMKNHIYIYIFHEIILCMWVRVL